DSAGYGTATITKAVSISNQDGVEAGVALGAAGDAITGAARADDVVNLRGLTVTGGGVGTSGIAFRSGLALNIDKCVIRDFTGSGIAMVNNVDAALVVTDTTVSGDFVGVFLGPSGTNSVTLSRLHATG